MNSTTVLQCKALPNVICKSEGECVAMALANPGNADYLSWIHVLILTPVSA